MTESLTPPVGASRSAPLAYRREGEGGALPTLVWLHGFLGSAEDWRPVMQALAGVGQHIAVDLPGHGASRRLPEEAYSMEGVASRLRQVLDEAAPGRRCLLAGYSMGGRVALHLAVRHPEWWDGILLESASPGLEDAAGRAERRRRDAHWARRFEEEALVVVLRDWYRQPVFATLTAATREAWAVRGARNEGAELARAIRGFSPGAQPPLWSALPALGMPVQFCVGGGDAAYVAIAERMWGLCPGAGHAIVSGAGHRVHEEAPGAFVKICEQWLAACGGRV